jgi:hypothetical protein
MKEYISSRILIFFPIVFLTNPHRIIGVSGIYHTQRDVLKSHRAEKITSANNDAHDLLTPPYICGNPEPQNLHMMIFDNLYYNDFRDKDF